MRRAAFALLGDYLNDFPDEVVDGKADKVALEFETELAQTPVTLDRDFLQRPEEIDILPPVVERLESWLSAGGIKHHAPRSIAVRLPSYFVYGMHCEFRDHPDVYQPLLPHIETPVRDALERDRDWLAYRHWLEWKLDEPMFGEGFSLKQLFQWPRGWYEERKPQPEPSRQRGRSDDDESDSDRQADVERRHVTDVRAALDEWLAKEDEAARDDPIRILSGDPGAGKSSCVRMYAKHRFEQGDRVLLVPLHLLDDPRKDLAGELELFCKQVPDRPTGLLDDRTAPDQLLLILDGLDELSKQGAAGASVAQAFVETVEKTVMRRNNDGLKLRVLLSGRPLAVQSVRNSFREEGRVLEMLPYWIPEDEPF
jgi:hypothetical protein